MSDNVIHPGADAHEASGAQERHGGSRAATGATDPTALFEDWFAKARASDAKLPDAMALATVDEGGLPDVRMVLLKGVDARGFVFFTNLSSAKGRQLAAHPAAAVVFHWKSLGRQVRARGRVEPVSGAEADAYFATRPREAQIGAWASDQSAPMPGPLALEARVAQTALRFGIGAIPRPPHWSGYRLVPAAIEFWSEKPFRLHERLLFERGGQGWTTRRLFP